MPRFSIELSEQEMESLAEMCAMSLSMLGQVMQELDPARVEAWQRLCISLLKAARGVPSIGKKMELNPDCGYWFFKRSYVDQSFYADVLDEYSDSVFWNELVGRMAEQQLVESIGEAVADRLSEEERASRVSSLEKALWHEVMHHGLQRLLFLLPSNES